MTASRIVATLAAALALACFAAEPFQMGTSVATVPGKGTATSVTLATVEVVSVDMATRNVTLKLADGRVFTTVAGDAVRNLQMVHAGDRIDVKYTETVTLELVREGRLALGRSESLGNTGPGPGQVAGGVSTRGIVTVLDVVGVDNSRNVLSVRDEHGKVTELQLGDPEQVKLARKGDQVQLTHVASVALALEPAAK